MVPILLGLFVPSFRRPLAGLLSSGVGLISTVSLNIIIMTTGTFDPVEETYIVQWFGMDFLQEFIMYITVPLSLAAFIGGLIMDRGKRS